MSHLLPARESTAAPQWALTMRALALAHAASENRHAGGVAGVGVCVVVVVVVAAGGVRIVAGGESSITPLTRRWTRAPRFALAAASEAGGRRSHRGLTDEWTVGLAYSCMYIFSARERSNSSQRRSSQGWITTDGRKQKITRWVLWEQLDSTPTRIRENSSFFLLLLLFRSTFAGLIIKMLHIDTQINQIS